MKSIMIFAQIDDINILCNIYKHIELHHFNFLEHVPNRQHGSNFTQTKGRVHW